MPKLPKSRFFPPSGDRLPMAEPSVGARIAQLDPARRKQNAERAMLRIDQLQPEIRKLVHAYGPAAVNFALMDTFQSSLVKAAKSGLQLDARDLAALRQAARDWELQLHRESMDPGSLLD